MRDSLLPAALLVMALALSLSLTGRRTARESTALLLAAALLTALMPPILSENIVFISAGLSTILAAGGVYLRQLRQPWPIRLIAVNSGLWAGTLLSLAPLEPGSLLILTLGLFYLPGRFIRRRWGTIAFKIAASWLIAIALLSLGLNLVPTPGYVPDHME